MGLTHSQGYNNGSVLNPCPVSEGELPVIVLSTSTCSRTVVTDTATMFTSTPHHTQHIGVTMVTSTPHHTQHIGVTMVTSTPHHTQHIGGTMFTSTPHHTQHIGGTMFTSTPHHTQHIGVTIMVTSTPHHTQHIGVTIMVTSTPHHTQHIGASQIENMPIPDNVSLATRSVPMSGMHKSLCIKLLFHPHLMD